MSSCALALGAAFGAGFAVWGVDADDDAPPRSFAITPS
jgi:hypothetical protein